MLVLIIFAFLAGAGTALSPCVLPVLPALLSAGSVGGRRRPLGIVLGLAVTFTVTIVGVANVVGGVGLGSRSAALDLAVAVLIVFGVDDDDTRRRARIEAPLSRLARFGPKNSGDGFCSGMRRRGRARLRLHAVRQPYPRRRHLGERGSRANGARRARLRGRARRSSCSSLALGGRRADGARAQRRPRPRAPAGARGDHDRHGPGDRHEHGRQLRPVRRAAHPRREPDREPGVLPHRHRTAARDHRARSEVQARRTAPPRAKGLLEDPRRRRERLAGRSCSPTHGRWNTSAPHRNSPTPRTGSTHRRATRCSSPRCAGRSCSSTSGLTRASTASAPSPT